VTSSRQKTNQKKTPKEHARAHSHDSKKGNPAAGKLFQTSKRETNEFFSDIFFFQKSKGDRHTATSWFFPREASPGALKDPRWGTAVLRGTMTIFAQHLLQHGSFTPLILCSSIIKVSN